MNIPIIAITGTKGKTTTTFVVSEVLRALKQNVLRVDTTGHFVNGERKSNLQDSKNAWGLVPSVSPGRYLYEFLVNPELQQNGVAVLESSVGSSSLSGMSYRSHNVGVFLNVYEDHLGSSSRLKTQMDIAEAKNFIFSRLERDGWVVFNADDMHVTSQLKVVPEHLDVKLLPCGLNFNHFDITKHVKNGGFALTVKREKVVLLSQQGEKTLVDLKAIPWTFEGTYMPSVQNVLLGAGAVLAHFDGEWPNGATKAFESLRLDPYGGRLTLLKAKNGATILADYAHEKVSLVEIAKLGRSLTKGNGKLIGVIRIANDRTDELIKETGEAVADKYDQIVVYDKIDGHFRQPRKVRSMRFPEEVGRVSETLSGAIKNAGGKVDRIIREDEAAKRASEIAGPGDVVVYIVNDDIERSIGFIKDCFKADFI